MTIYIASDHAGFTMKQKIVSSLKSTHNVVDLGTFNEDRTDYPDEADKVIGEIKKDPSARGILLCGSGQGMAMRANKYSFIRAALCWSEESAALSRQHNDANVLCLGARLLPEDVLLRTTQVFFQTPFEGGRHADRVKKVSKPTGQ